MIMAGIGKSAVISKGIYLYINNELLSNLMEIPELGGSQDAIEITTLEDAAHTYTGGLLNYGESLDFKFLYEETQFMSLNSNKNVVPVKVELPDGNICQFSGTLSVKLDGVGVNAALTYTLSVKPITEMVWGEQGA